MATMPLTSDMSERFIYMFVAPYLITTRGLDYNQSFDIINYWLYNKCDKIERLNPSNFNHIIKEALNWSIHQKLETNIIG